LQATSAAAGAAKAASAPALIKLLKIKLLSLMNRLLPNHVLVHPDEEKRFKAKFRSRSVSGT
jgi:hypothetical protein